MPNNMDGTLTITYKDQEALEGSLLPDLRDLKPQAITMGTEAFAVFARLIIPPDLKITDLPPTVRLQFNGIPVTVAPAFAPTAVKLAWGKDTHKQEVP